MRLAIATCDPLPEPDPDQAPLTAALAARGIETTLVPWHDEAVDWAGFDACVIRSTWDYHRRPDAFLAWVDRVATLTRLHNPAAVIRWNAHKAYLLELAGAGIPTTPTVLLRRGNPTPLQAVVAAQGWERVVVKPAVSAGSFDTIAVDAADPDGRGEAHLRALLAREDALVQRYLSAVEGYGERALVAIGGELTHAVRKNPRLLGDDESVTPVPIEPAERALADTLLSWFPGLLYGRVDLCPGPDGAPCVMELELIEPSLFTRHDDAANARLADAIAAL